MISQNKPMQLLADTPPGSTSQTEEPQNEELLSSLGHLLSPALSLEQCRCCPSHHLLPATLPRRPWPLWSRRQQWRLLPGPSPYSFRSSGSSPLCLLSWHRW